MPQDWQSIAVERGHGRWLRRRWPEGSLFVLDGDSEIMSRDYARGIFIEWKFIKAQNPKWTWTRLKAQRCGFWSALFRYETDDDSPDGYPVRILATFCAPEGEIQDETELDTDDFFAWVAREFGNGARNW